MCGQNLGTMEKARLALRSTKESRRVPAVGLIEPHPEAQLREAAEESGAVSKPIGNTASR